MEEQDKKSKDKGSGRRKRSRSSESRKRKQDFNEAQPNTDKVPATDSKKSPEETKCTSKAKSKKAKDSLGIKKIQIPGNIQDQDY